MKKIRFHSDQIKRPCRKKKKKTQCHGITNIKKPKKVNGRKARKQFIYALKLSDTLVTPICSVKLWGFKGLKKLEKTTRYT